MEIALFCLSNVDGLKFEKTQRFMFLDYWKCYRPCEPLRLTSDTPIYPKQVEENPNRVLKRIIIIIENIKLSNIGNIIEHPDFDNSKFRKFETFKISSIF